MELFMITQKQNLARNIFCEQKAEMKTLENNRKKKFLEKHLEFFLYSVDVNYFSVKGWKCPEIIIFFTVNLSPGSETEHQTPF